MSWDPKNRRSAKHKRQKAKTADLSKPPSAEELASSPHTHEAADRFSLYTMTEIDKLTRPVRIDLTFEDVMEVRAQAAMIAEGMQTILRLTREYKVGSIRQLIECRKEAASLGAALRSIIGGHKG